MVYKKRSYQYVPESQEPWRISRSKIDLFVECPLCFYLDQRKGIKRPSIPAFTLNSAVDILLKKEFDIHRAKNQTHPLMEKYKINAIPFSHEKMDDWRHNFTGVEYFHQPTNFLVFGAIDDLWVSPKGELYVVDYKSTSKEDEITLDDQWKEGYKRQMAIYQWIIRKNGFNVSDTGYFVFANGQKDREAFDGKLEFDVTIIAYEADSSWVEDTLFKMKETLDQEDFPEANPSCEHCNYRSKIQNVMTPDIS